MKTNYLAQYRSLENKYVECICPKCQIKHKKRMLWAGRGTPKKFCDVCKHYRGLVNIDEYHIGRMGRHVIVTGSE